MHDVPSSARCEPQRLNVRQYASPHRLLRPRWMPILTILRTVLKRVSRWIMDRLSTGLRPVGFLILVGAGLLATWWIAAGCVWAGDGQAGGSDSARAQRIEELQKQRDRIQRELNQLKQQPEGVSRSVIPRSEMSDQPVRTLKESMESVPGVAVSPGAGGRTVDLSIRGSGK